MRAAATALAFALFAAPAGAQELEREYRPEGQVSAAVALGGGYRSDLYLGAGLAGQGVAAAAPTLGLDLSAAPWLKLFAELDGDAEHAFQSGAGAYELAGDVVLQFRPLAWLYPEVILAGQQDWYTHLAVQTDPSNPAAPPVTTSHQASVSLGLRSSQGPLEARLLASGGQRVSSGLEVFEEYPLSLTAYAGYQVMPRLRLGLQYRLGDNLSPRDELAFWGQELSLGTLLSLAPGPLLRLRAAIRRNAFDQGGTTWAPQAALGLSQPVWRGVSVELAYRFEQVHGSGYAEPALLHSGYLGVRAEGGPWRF